MNINNQKVDHEMDSHQMEAHQPGHQSSPDNRPPPLMCVNKTSSPAKTTEPIASEYYPTGEMHEPNNSYLDLDQSDLYRNDITNELIIDESINNESANNLRDEGSNEKPIDNRDLLGEENCKMETSTNLAELSDKDVAMDVAIGNVNEDLNGNLNGWFYCGSDLNLLENYFDFILA